MSNAARSVFYFALFLYLVGLTLMIIPNIFLKTMQFPETNEVWIRVVGLLAFNIGYYYHRMAKKNITEFFKYTIPTRLFVFLVFGIFVILEQAPTTLVLIGSVDLAGAILTWSALRQKEKFAAK